MGQTANDAGWIGLGGVEGRLVVEREIDASGFLRLPGQRGFAHPSPSDD